MTLKNITQSVKSNVQNIDDLLGSIEAAALAVTTRAAAWVSTIPTVMLTSRTISNVFQLSDTAGLLSSIALEIVGQSTADLWISAKSWNETKRKSDPAASEKLAFAMMCTYFVSDFALVSVLELPFVFQGDITHLASLLFPIMQVVSTLVLTERAKQFRREAAIEAEKLERSRKRSERKKKRSDMDSDRLAIAPADRPKPVQNGTLNGANRSRANGREAKIEQLLDVYRNDPELSYRLAGEQVGRSKSWVGGVIAELEEAGKVHRNGEGVKVLEGAL